jgi:hypothetical protein
MGTLG